MSIQDESVDEVSAIFFPGHTEGRVRDQSIVSTCIDLDPVCDKKANLCFDAILFEIIFGVRENSVINFCKQ